MAPFLKPTLPVWSGYVKYNNAYALWSTDGGAEFAEAQSLAFGYRTSPLLLPAITMPAGGSILYFVVAAGIANMLTPTSGCIADVDFTLETAVRFWGGQRGSTGQPGVTMSADWGGEQALAIALQP